MSHARSATPLSSIGSIARRAVAAVALAMLPCAAALAQTQLTVASPDSGAALFKELDAAFIAQYKKSTGRDVRIEQKPVAPARLAKAMEDGLVADVVAPFESGAIDALAAAGLAAVDWRKRFPSDSAPWATTVVFVVRGGNPKRIKDWSDLARPGIRVVTADPDTDATGRWAWLGAWGALSRRSNNDRKAARLASGLLRNATPLAPDARAAAETFRQGEGDALLALEANARSMIEDTAGAGGGAGKPGLVHPGSSVLVERPVTIVDSVTRKKGTGELAKAYVNFMLSDAGQRIGAAHGLRPRSNPGETNQAGDFKPLKLFTVAEAFGSLAEAEKAHFGAGGHLDRLRRTPAK